LTFIGGDDFDPETWASDLFQGLQAVAAGHRVTSLSKQDVPVPPNSARESRRSRRAGIA
jgi:hypothetical protein